MKLSAELVSLGLLLSTATGAQAAVAGVNPETAAYLSNMAAGVVVGKAGTATVTREELLARLGEPP